MEVKTDDKLYNFIKSSFLKNVILDDEMLYRIGEDRLFLFIIKYANDYKKAKSKPCDHYIDSWLAKSSYQKEFKKLLFDAYGPHTKKILDEHPNLTLHTIEDYRVFYPCLYETFGENFIHQLLNNNYSSLCHIYANESNDKEDVFDDLIQEKNMYNKIMNSIVYDKEKLKSFKFCYDVICEEYPNELFNYARLFLIYSNYYDLFNDIYNKKLSNEQMQDLKDIIADTANVLRINSFERLNNYKEINRNYYNACFRNANSVVRMKQAIFERFFKLEYSYNFGRATYTKDCRNIAVLSRFYNLDRFIKYQEAIKYDDTKPKEAKLSKEELDCVKLVYAIDTMLGVNSIRYLSKLYNVLDRKKDFLKPGECNKIFSKIPSLCSKDMIDSLITVEDLELAVKNNEAGIRKEYVRRKIRNDETIQIPIYHLEGKKFAMLVTAVEENMSGYVYPKRKMASSWFNYEKGVSTISCSYISHDIPCGMEFINKHHNQQSYINYMMGKDARVVAMGSEDIYSNPFRMNPNSYSLEKTSFLYPDDLLLKSVNKEFNEVTIERYALDTNRFAGKIIPEAIFKNGKMPHNRIIEHAKEFTAFVRKNNLKDENYVMPIVMYDKDCYNISQVSQISNRNAFTKMMQQESERFEESRTVIERFIDQFEQENGEIKKDENYVTNEYLNMNYFLNDDNIAE